ncbi:MAG: glycoside hydrolase family 2 TIM barrel-domain containing protein [Puniceicoccaceae bacterium]
MKQLRAGLVILGGVFACAQLWAEAIPVRVIEQDGKFTLHRDGEPYFIKGVGGTSMFELLAETGGNSLRTWGSPDYDKAFLDRAHEADLSVAIGMWVDHERHGFDYSDDAVVRDQIERHCKIIDKYKDHPAVLLWGIGNEVELQSKNPRVWDVIEAVAAYAKKVDPNHPTMTVIAQSKHAIEMVRDRCPSVDILGLNSYGGIKDLSEEVRKAGWEKPYIVTEWGVNGSWEVGKTSWGASLEPTSTQKAQIWRDRHDFISGDSNRSLGGYAFYWGSKQETTPTWFGAFLEDGSRTELVESLQESWTGSLPEIKAPKIKEYRLNGKRPDSSVVMRSGKTAEASFKIKGGFCESMRTSWDLAPESTMTGIGGDREDRPDSVSLSILADKGDRLRFVVPEQAGQYRLFLYVYGEDDTVATANFPFLVK